MFDQIMYFSLLFAMLPRTDYAPYILWPDNFSKIFLLNFFSLLLTTPYIACGILVPQPGPESGTPAMEAQSPNWTTRKVPDHIIINFKLQSLNIIVVQSLSHVLLFATPWTAARQVSLSFTISWSLFRFMSTESVMLPNHLILHLPVYTPIENKWIKVFPNRINRVSNLPKNCQELTVSSSAFPFILFKIFSCGPFFKSLLNWLQHCFCFLSLYFGPEACGILALWSEIKPSPPASEGGVLTTAPLGKSLVYSWDISWGLLWARLYIVSETRPSGAYTLVENISHTTNKWCICMAESDMLCERQKKLSAMAVQGRERSIKPGYMQWTICSRSEAVGWFWTSGDEK